MKHINCFDIRLEKDVYYRGETLIGCLLLENDKPLRVRSIRCILRGRAKVHWKVYKSGETRWLTDDQYLLDEKLILWGGQSNNNNNDNKARDRNANTIAGSRSVTNTSALSALVAGGGKLAAPDGLTADGGAVSDADFDFVVPDDRAIQQLPAGAHQFNFSFALPQSQHMPCSLETRIGTVRYYVKVIIDVAYATSPPQGLKYFTFVGPHIDCMEEKYLSSMSGQDHRWRRGLQCLQRCCRGGAVGVRVVLERTAYCCGESIRMRAQVENRQEMTICLCVRLFQTIEYRIDRSAACGGAAAMGGGPTTVETKTRVSTALEYRMPSIVGNATARFNTSKFEHPIRVPILPPTMIGACRIIQIYYRLQVCVEDDRKNESLPLDFPFTIATIPYRSGQSQFYTVGYDFCVDYVESGRYVAPEFRIGNVYDGLPPDGNRGDGNVVADEYDAEANGGPPVIEEIVLYRPVYVKVLDAITTANVVDTMMMSTSSMLTANEPSGGRRLLNMINGSGTSRPSSRDNLNSRASESSSSLGAKPSLKSCEAEQNCNVTTAIRPSTTATTVRVDDKIGIASPPRTAQPV